MRRAIPTVLSQNNPRLTARKDNSGLLFFVAAFLLVCGIQAGIGHSWGVAMLVAASICGVVMGAAYVKDVELWEKYPVSMISLVGYALYYFVLPPIVTLSEGEVVSVNLDSPGLVALHSLLCYAVLIAAHALYRNARWVQEIRLAITRALSKYTPVFAPVHSLQLFAMGLLGCAAVYQQLFIKDVYYAQDLSVQSVVDKFIQGFFPFAYLPYVVLVPFFTGGSTGRKLSARIKLSILLYSVIIFLIAMGHNSRSTMLIGMASIAVCYVIGIVTGRLNIRIFTLRNFFIFLIASYIIVGPLADLATAMVIARAGRNTASASSVVSDTLKAFMDKRALELARIEDITDKREGPADERYSTNVFLNRLCNLRFADISITQAINLSDGQKSQFRQFEFQRILSILPEPVLKTLRLDANKAFVNKSSSGDILYFITSGNRYALEGYRTGSIFGSGYIVLGWWYLLVLGIIAMVTFVMMDSLVRINFLGGRYVTTIAVISIITLFNMLFYWTSAAAGIDSLSGLFLYIIRGWIQFILLYMLAFFLTYPLRLIKL